MSDPISKLRRALTPSGLLVTAGLVLAGCASDAELDTLEPQSDVAREIDGLLDPVLAVAGVVLVIIVGGVLWLGWANRVKGSDYDDEEFPRGSI